MGRLPAAPPGPATKNAKHVAKPKPTESSLAAPGRNLPRPIGAQADPAEDRLPKKFVSGNGLTSIRAFEFAQPRLCPNFEKGDPVAAGPPTGDQFRARPPASDPTAVCFLFDTAFRWNLNPDT